VRDLSSRFLPVCHHLVVMAALSLLFSVLATGVHAGIYPDGHFDRATELNADNVDSFVKDNVDAGKTVFIRWIASEG